MNRNDLLAADVVADVLKDKYLELLQLHSPDAARCSIMAMYVGQLVETTKGDTIPATKGTGTSDKARLKRRGLIRTFQNMFQRDPVLRDAKDFVGDLEVGNWLAEAIAEDLKGMNSDHQGEAS